MDSNTLMAISIGMDLAYKLLAKMEQKTMTPEEVRDYGIQLKAGIDTKLDEIDKLVNPPTP